MFVYFFDKWYGSDRVSYLDGYSSIQKKELPLGSVVSIDGDIGLVLGDGIAWSEKCTYTTPCNPSTVIRCIFKKAISKQSLLHIHWFVEYRFTTYKKTIPLYLNEDTYTRDFPKKTLTKTTQKLYIYPTVWALSQIDIALSKDVAILHSSSTGLQKAKVYHGIKKGIIKELHCTFSQIFQDRKNLHEIIVYDVHSRWYKNQKEPRRYLPTTIEHLASIHQAKVIFHGLMIDGVEEEK